MEPVPEPSNLRLLRVLVTVLTGVMIAGLIAVVVALVTRLPSAAIRSPEGLAIPAGTEIVAVTQAPSYWLVTTGDDRLLVFAPDGSLLRDIPLGD
ncbi:DUF6476 family protein [uncultured Jannaschia sp.]|uniref:DUF6476 family protein n=1 Tax=uncultured Jannaschia sp. TaxID=293347 RepID=UPI00262C879E|nr:DUF6476 family protein [uncultured Jannaschia sp.]